MALKWTTFSSFDQLSISWRLWDSDGVHCKSGHPVYKCFLGLTKQTIDFIGPSAQCGHNIS